MMFDRDFVRAEEMLEMARARDQSAASNQSLRFARNRQHCARAAQMFLKPFALEATHPSIGSFNGSRCRPL
jgi:hypothetical protein